MKFQQWLFKILRKQNITDGRKDKVKTEYPPQTKYTKQRFRGFEPHWRHCAVSLSKNINPSLVMVQPRKTCPYITERLLMGRKESNQTKTFNIILQMFNKCTIYGQRCHYGETILILKSLRCYFSYPKNSILNNYKVVLDFKEALKFLGQINECKSKLLRTLVKSAYQKNNFLISQPKHMLWVLQRTISMRRFFCSPKTYVKTDW